MDSLEPRLKRCRSCGACSESMDKCQTCKNKYKIKWSVSFNFHMFNRSVCFISKWPGPSKTWLFPFLPFVLLRCCPYKHYIYIGHPQAPFMYLCIHSFTSLQKNPSICLFRPLFFQLRDLTHISSASWCGQSGAHQIHTQLANHSLYFSGTTAANHAKLLIGRATKNIISL